VDPGSEVVDPGSEVVDPGSEAVDPGSEVLDPGSEVVDPGSEVVDPGTEVDDPGTGVTGGTGGTEYYGAGLDPPPTTQDSDNLGAALISLGAELQALSDELDQHSDSIGDLSDELGDLSDVLEDTNSNNSNSGQDTNATEISREIGSSSGLVVSDGSSDSVQDTNSTQDANSTQETNNTQEQTSTTVNQTTTDVGYTDLIGESEEDVNIGYDKISKTLKSPVPFGPCGDGYCDGLVGENCETCPQDCIGGLFNPVVCGNGWCEEGETCRNCPSDCASHLGKGVKSKERICCQGGPKEHVKSAEAFHDCTTDLCNFNVKCTLEPAPASTPFCCGNGVCEPGEGVWNCRTDCKCVDNGKCEPFEDGTCEDCQADAVAINTQCMGPGSACQNISPDPCCFGCLHGTCKSSS